jgi:hypothetical protein
MTIPDELARGSVQPRCCGGCAPHTRLFVMPTREWRASSLHGNWHTGLKT